MLNGKSLRNPNSKQQGRAAAQPPDPAAQSNRYTYHLDDKARRIIEILQHDGRASYTDIGREIGLSEAAVRARIVRLSNEGIINIVAVSDPKHLGFYRQAMLGIKVDGPVSKVADKLRDVEQIIYVIQTAGRFDLLIEVVCKDDKDLLHFKDTLLEEFSEIGDCETFVYLDVHKQVYSWGAI